MKQMGQVFQMTRRYDSSAVWIILLAALLPVLLGVLLGILLGDGNGFVIALWILVGLLAGMVEKLPDDGPFPKSDIALDGVIEALVGTAPAVEGPGRRHR